MKIQLNNSLRILAITVTFIFGKGMYAQDYSSPTNAQKSTQELIDLSKQKWQWMSERNVDSLKVLFHKEAIFVHMGGAMNKEQEINTIKSGGIYYKQADIKETSVRFVGNTAIILDRIRLTAVVGGNEVVNPFIVTEVYILIDSKWKLGSLSFTRLLGE